MNKNNSTFKWDPFSAGRKLAGDSKITVGNDKVGKWEKEFKPHDPKQDAYRNCSMCGKHYNYHKNGKCP